MIPIPTSSDIVALRSRANYSNIQSFDSAPFFFSSIFPKGESIEDETVIIINIPAGKSSSRFFADNLARRVFARLFARL